MRWNRSWPTDCAKGQIAEFVEARATGQAGRDGDAARTSADDDDFVVPRRFQTLLGGHRLHN